MFVFFDIGDTLVDEADFARLRHRKILEFLIAHGVALTAEQYDTNLNNLSMRGRLTLFEQLRWIVREAGASQLTALAVFRDYILQVAPQAPRRFHPFPSAYKCLRDLTQRADEPYRLGIIANQPTWIRGSMIRWDLLQFFEPDSVIISDEVAVSKPDLDIFRFGLQQAGVEAADAIMVGNDYLNDIQPAKELGMWTVWIERPDPYAPGAPPQKDTSSADMHVTKLADVPAAIDRLVRAQRTPNTPKARKAPSTPVS